MIIKKARTQGFILEYGKGRRGKKIRKALMALIPCKRLSKRIKIEKRKIERISFLSRIDQIQGVWVHIYTHVKSKNEFVTAVTNF